MPQDENRDRLLAFLDDHFFDPVVKASPYDYPDEPLQRRLRDAQSAVRSMKSLYVHSTSGKDVVQSFRSDLQSDAVRRVDAALRELGLPALGDLEQEFLQLAYRLGLPE
jgi:hypothetical protein